MSQPCVYVLWRSGWNVQRLLHSIYLDLGKAIEAGAAAHKREGSKRELVYYIMRYDVARRVGEQEDDELETRLVWTTERL